ncbi:hypothetical protein Btru_055248 [Bulinus truncatus]|nr:hypothetical protein Btru_055248 [Bulinus truncatus]
MECSNYECPNLPIQELVQFLKEANIDVSDKDFKSPDPRKWRVIFGQMFESHSHKPLDHVIQHILMVNAVDECYQDYREEGFALMAYTLCLQRIFSACGFKDFCMRDVVQPTPDRVQKMSSCFLNNTRHGQIRRQFIEESYQKIQASAEQSMSIVNKNKALRESYEKARGVQPLCEAEVQQKTEELEREQQPILELTKVQEEEMRLTEEAKLRNAEIKSEKEQVKQTIAHIQQDCDTLSRKVVKSPKRFQSELDRLKTRVLDLKNEHRTKEQYISENKLLLEKTMGKRLALQKAVKLSAEVTSDTVKHNELDKEIKQLREVYNEYQEVYKKYAVEEEDLTDKLSIRQQVRNKVLNQVDMNKTTVSQQLNDFIQHQSKLQESSKSLRSEKSVIQGKITANSNIVEELGKTDESNEKEFQKKCQSLTDEINEFNLLLVEKVQEVKDVFN